MPAMPPSVTKTKKSDRANQAKPTHPEEALARTRLPPGSPKEASSESVKLRLGLP